MSKKIISMILALLAIAMITGCSSDKEKDSESAAPQTTAAPTSNSGAAEDTAAPEDTDSTSTEAESDAPAAGDNSTTVIFSSGLSVPLGAAAEDVIPSLGDPADQFEAPSCLHPGNDVIYYYDGFSVTTQPDEDGNNIVTAVELTADTAVLENGLSVNSSVDDVKAAYGEDFTEEFGQIKYDFGKMTLDVVSDADQVIALAFTLVW